MQQNRDLHRDGFETYRDWWSRVDRVRVNDVRVIREDRNEAEVDVDITYEMNNGNVSRDQQRLIWIWQEAGNLWVIDRTEDRTERPPD
jgi:hypothetical protein